MRSTMMDVPLLVSRLLTHGSTVHGRSEVVTWTGAGPGPRRMPYGEVGATAAQLAHALRDDLGVTGDQRVATFMWNNAEHLVAYLAVPSMGAVLHTLNLRLFPDQVAYIANHAGDRVVLVDATLVPLLARSLPQMSTVEHVVLVGDGDQQALAAAGGGRVAVHHWADLVRDKPRQYDWPDLDERTAAALCYTSGTTGNPRGVAYSHRSIWLHSMQICAMEAFALAPTTRELVIVPMFHAMAWGLPYAAVMSGASLLMPDRFLQAAPLAEMIERERPTLAGAVPTIWNDLLQHLRAHPVDTSSLKEAIVGGSACPPALMHAFADEYGIEVIHAWGMTEMSPLGSVARPPAGVTEEESWAYRYTQGRLPAAVQGRIVGPGGDVLPSDGKSVGELEVRGPWITASYLGDPDDPGAAPDGAAPDGDGPDGDGPDGDGPDGDGPDGDGPDGDGPDAAEKFHDGWLRTGDVGMLSPDGYLTLTDRAKDVIKSGGEWISSVELENALMAHPDVVEACVVGVPDDRWGERPLAGVVLREGAKADPEQLRDFLAGRVAHWQLPERWTFIEAVPKTSVGKFDKKRVRTAYAAGDMDVTTL